MSGLINYVKKTFKNYPDTTTRISAENLNHLDNGIFDLDQAAGQLRDTLSVKANISSLTAGDGLQFQFSKQGTNYGYINSSGTFVPFKNPTGTKSITSNGTYNVTDYASASVIIPTYAIRRYAFNVNGTSCTISGNGQTASVSLNSQETIGIDGLVSCFAWSNGYFRLGAYGLCYHDGVLKAYGGIFKDVENYHTYSCTIDYLIRA